MKRLQAIKFILALAICCIQVLTFQNCAGTISGNPVREISKLDIKFSAFQSNLKSVSLCVSNVRLQAADIFGELQSDSIVPLPSGESENGFDLAYFYYDTTAGKYFVNGIYLNKKVQLNSLGTLIASVTVPRGNYEQMIIGFSRCHDDTDQTIIVPSLKVENDHGTYADIASGQFVLIYDGERFVTGVDKGEFDIESFTNQLQPVQSQNDLLQVLGIYRQYDLLSFSATALTNFYKAKLNDLKTQSSGKLIAGGHAYQWSNYFLIARYNANGVLDETFGTGSPAPGLVTEFASSSDHGVTGLAIRSDDAIFAVGHRNSGDSTRILDVGVLKLSANGIIDTGFGTSGWANLPKARNQYGSDIVILNDNKILVTAVSEGRFADGSNEFLLYKLQSDGTPDQTFGQNGIYTGTIVSANYSDKTPLAIQDDQKIVLGLTNNDPSGTSWVIRRFMPDSTPDSSFNSAGPHPGEIKLFPGGSAKIKGVKIQADQKIILAGSVSRDTGFAVARLLPNGTLDNSFATNGIYRQTFTGLTVTTKAVEITENHEILVTGSIEGADGASYFLLALDQDGMPKFYSDPKSLRLFSVNSGARGGTLLYPPGDRLYIGGSAPMNVFHILGIKK
jgi:uncharacterized delta-60 repeat protein